jgi:hypothetical protein
MQLPTRVSRCSHPEIWAHIDRSASRHLALLNLLPDRMDQNSNAGRALARSGPSNPDSGTKYHKSRARRWQEDEQGQSTDIDPDNWPALREQSHRMLDDMLDHLQTIRDKPLWQSAPASARALFNAPLPNEPTDLAGVYATFRDNILPYGSGNIHPGFMGWVQGGGTVTGMLADMLSAKNPINQLKKLYFL